MSELIRLTEVTKVYQGGITGALNGASVTVEKGELTAIMGPSGSGKSSRFEEEAGLSGSGLDPLGAGFARPLGARPGFL